MGVVQRVRAILARLRAYLAGMAPGEELAAARRIEAELRRRLTAAETDLGIVEQEIAEFAAEILPSESESESTVVETVTDESESPDPDDGPEESESPDPDELDAEAATESEGVETRFEDV